jgi:hypothetical protein
MSFIIKTNHLNLKHLLEQRLTHSLQHKGLSKLLDMKYVIQYKKGVKNRVFDALSRREHTDMAGQGLVVTEINPKWIEDLRDNYINDQWTQQLIS